MTSDSRPKTPVSPGRRSEDWESWLKWDGTTNGKDHSRETDLASKSIELQSTVSRKRKSSSISDHDPGLSHGNEDSKPPPGKKSHNIVERRYRTNINDKIAALRDSVSTLRTAKSPQSQSNQNDAQPPAKLNKGTVLSTAVEYIQSLEKDKQCLELEISNLKARLRTAEQRLLDVDTSEKAVVVSSAATSTDDSQTSACISTGSSGWSNSVQGMIELPEDMRRLRTASLQAQYAESSYMDHIDTPRDEQGADLSCSNGARRTKVMGKLMFGTFAGLMVMQGFGEGDSEPKKTNKRSLFAIPAHLRPSTLSFAWFSLSPHFGAHHSQLLFAILKAFLVLFIIAFTVFLYAFCSKPKTKKQTLKPTSAPSLASPLEVRRNAWLTAIQTVRVPRHKFLPEWGAVNLEALQYVLRQVIGWRGYSWLTNQSEDDEVARVRAWDIAIDAQLMGGDAEISGSRLLLTILASGTLPKTPGRLILKAIHVRILLWKASRPGQGSLWSIVHSIAALLADQQWRCAQNLQKEPVIKTEQPPYEIESLPEHLAALLQLGCSEVLTDPIIQRAHNLAWSRPTREDVHGTEDEMDLVVDDFTIRSPHDALCAWLSSTTLQKALFGSLKSDVDDSPELEWHFGVALHTAPPASIAQARALAANAVFVEANHQNALKMLLQDSVPKDAGAKDIAASITAGSTSFIDSSLPKAIVHDIELVTFCALTLETLQHDSANWEDFEQALHTLTAGYSEAKELTWLSFATAYRLVCSVALDDDLRTHYKRHISSLCWRLLMWLEVTETSNAGLEQATETEIEAMLSKHVEVDNKPQQQTSLSEKSKTACATKAAHATTDSKNPSFTNQALKPSKSSSATTHGSWNNPLTNKRDRRFSRSSLDSGYFSVRSDRS